MNKIEVYPFSSSHTIIFNQYALILQTNQACLVHEKQISYLMGLWMKLYIMDEIIYRVNFEAEVDGMDNCSGLFIYGVQFICVTFKNLKQCTL